VNDYRSESLLLLGADSETALRQLAADAIAVIRRDDAALATVASLGDGPWRAAVVARQPDGLADQLERIEPRRASRPPRIGFVFPGQGVAAAAGPGALAGTAARIEELYEHAALGDAEVERPLVQLAVATAALAALAAVGEYGLTADLAVGHSLGELVALHWAGALSERAVQRLARARGAAMTTGVVDGAMAALLAVRSTVEDVINGSPVVIACENGPANFVISGPSADVASVVARAREAGVRALPLQVTGAFHSPSMAPAVECFSAHLAAERISTPTRTVISTVTGTALSAEDDLHALLRHQIQAPVLFVNAASEAADRVDLLVELGPGRTMTALLRSITDVPCVSVRTDAGDRRGLYEALARAHVLGARLRIPALETSFA